MRTPERILCGVSTAVGNESHELAPGDCVVAQTAIDLAERVGARVHFLHVVDWLDARLRKEVPAPLPEVAEVRAALEGLVADASKRGVEGDFSMETGRPGDRLLEAAGTRSADLLAIGPSRKTVSSLRRVLHGRTCRRILNASEAPVWVVPPEPRPVRRILALVDLTPASRVVVEAADMLSATFGADRFALACIDFPADPSLRREAGGREKVARYHQRERESAREQLRELTGGEGWTLRVGEDWVVRQAPAWIEEAQLDLVVLVGGAKPGLSDELLGSTAKRLLDRIAVSTWVIPTADRR